MTRVAKRRFGIAAAVIAAIAIAACTLTLSLGDGERRTVARDLTADVILPTYDDVVTASATLATAADAFAQAPAQATLVALRDAWRAARVPWKRSDAFRFGPMTLQSIATAIDQFPVDPTKIEAEIAGTTAIDAAYFTTLGANKKGFHAIEYLVFDASGSGDAALIAAFTADPRRAAFVAGAAADLATNARALRDGWADYAALLADPGADNAEFPTVKDSIDALVNEIVFQAEVVADARIGKPAGTTSGGTVQPELAESTPSDNSLADMTDALDSIRAIYTGTRDGSGDQGISRLIVAKSPALDRDVRAALAAALAAVAAIPRPYSQALLAGDARIMTAYTAVQDLQHLLATEVISTLGATLEFNDNDGD